MVNISKKHTLGRRGITLMELLIATLMITMVFVASTSVYVSALKFLSTMVTNSTSLSPTVSLEDIAKHISLANEANPPGNGGKSLDLRGDYDFNNSSWNSPLNTPSVFGDDAWIHYRFCGAANGDLRMVCDQTPNTNVPCGGGTVMMSNVDSASSSFAATSSDWQGNPTVIRVVLRASPGAAFPTMSTQETSALLGAKSAS
jgi:hypothetical protein